MLDHLSGPASLPEASAPAEGPPRRRVLRRPSLTASVAVVSVVVLTALYANVAARVYPGDSDTATLVLQGRSVLDGHVLLNGWRMVFDSFWTVEVPFYAVGVALTGVDPRLMYIVPGLFAALVVVLAAGLAREGRRGLPAVAAVATAVLLIGLPSGVWALVLLRAGWHVATVLYCLVAFALLRTPTFGWRWALAVGLLAAALLGDLQAIPLGVGPVLGAGFVAMLRTRRLRAGLAVASAGPAAVAVAYVARHLAEVVGTYAVNEGNPPAETGRMVDTLQSLPDRLAQVVGSGTGRLAPADMPAAFGSVRYLTAVAVAAAVVVGLVLLVRGVVTGSAPDDRDEPQPWRLDDLLVLGALADLAFAVYATRSDDPGYLRYVTPFVLFGACLAARYAGRAAEHVRRGWFTGAATAAAVVVALLFVAGFVRTSTRPVTQARAGELARFLEVRNLTNGIAPYWSAAVTTVESEGAVSVRPVIGDPTGHIVRYGKQSTDLWYARTFQFLVLDPLTPWPGVSERTAARTFGPPAQRYQVGSYEVLTWDHPISVSPTVVYPGGSR